MVPPYRLLCLHSFRTNAAIMQLQLSGIYYSFKKTDLSIDFLNGTYESIHPSDITIQETFGTKGPFYEWFQYKRKHDLQIETDFTKLTNTKGILYDYEGIEQSLDRLDDYFQSHGNYDVLVGFSQGATLATAYTMKCQKNGKKFPYQLVLLFSGVAPSPHSYTYFTKGLTIPSIHVISPNDTL